MPGIDPEPRLVWLHAVLDLLPVPAQLVEHGSGRIRLANAAARGLPPFEPDGRRGRATADATDAEGRPILPEQWPQRRAARGEAIDGEEITWHWAGERASFLVSSGSVPARDGETPLVLLTYSDVSRLRRTEEELREAVRVRDEFVSVASHELKDPLAALLLCVGFLRRLVQKHGAVPADVLRERLEFGERQGQRLGRMIDNLLDVSRIDHGRLQLQVESLDLRDVVHDVVGRYQEQSREAGAPLVVEPSGPVVGDFDRLQLEHAVGNLVSNALKYGAGRPVTIRTGGDEAIARLEVEDRGVGIAEADRSRIFERFQRAAADHREQSLGLGLHIVRSVVEAHGGSIGVRSEPGQGTTFVVELPRRQTPAGASGPRAAE
ncbi:MAG: sensor histidine kinase [Isosphaeraceae bacterium]